MTRLIDPVRVVGGVSHPPVVQVGVSDAKEIFLTCFFGWPARGSKTISPFFLHGKYIIFYVH